MSESNKAKIAAARRLLKEHQKKKEVNQVSTTDIRSPLSSAQSSSTTDRESHYGNGFPGASGFSETPSPTNVASLTPLQSVNGSHLPGFSFPNDYSSNPSGQFFDNLPPVQPFLSDENAFKPVALTPPLFNNQLASTDRTDSSCSVSTKSDDDSARRLVALECQLAVEIERKEELESRLGETKENVNFLEKEMARLQDMVTELSKDRSPHEEKYNMQLRTIEILVSEKAELQQELASVTEENRQNSDKCIELSVKMKALKSEVARLQTEARDNNEARQQHNSILKRLEHSLNEANSLAEQYKKEVEMNREEIKELRRIIHESDQSNIMLKKELEESNRKLSLAEMKLAQSGGSMEESVSSYPQNFEGECEKLRQEVARMRVEVAENTSQYKHYIETLNGQLHHMNEEHERCMQEKNELLAHKEGLVKQLCDLEKQISKERQAGPSLSQSNVHLHEQLTAALKTLEETKSELVEKTKSHDQLAEQLASTAVRLQETELALEQLEVPDAKLLQAAMESDRVAASRAIEQNTSLKAQLNELSAEMSHSIVKLNNEKLDLTEKLQHSEHLVKDLQGKLERYRHKEDVLYTDSVAQCPMIFQSDYSTQTDVDDLEIVIDPEHATPESMKLLEEKLKKTMEQVAALTEEKQRLEHLVLQLQGETETICEYVTLYQNQRGLLREKVVERERQLALLAKERKELKEKLGQINRLLPHVTSGSQDLTSGECSDVDRTAASKIKSLLTEIEESNLVQEKLDSTPNSFHPCLLCSGKLITV